MEKKISVRTVLLVLSAALNVLLYVQSVTHQCPVLTERVRDTIVEFRRDFDTVYVAKTLYRDVYRWDTVMRDSVVYVKDVPRDYRFEEEDYTLDVSAVKLEKYHLSLHAKDTIRETIPVIVKEKQPRLSVGPAVYYGTGGIGMGVALTYNILNIK